MRRVKVSEIEREARRLVHTRQWLVILAEIFAIVVFPLTIGILTQHMDKMGDYFWYTVVPLAIAQVFLGGILLLGAKNEFLWEAIMFKEKSSDTQNTKAAAATQATGPGYVSSGFEKRREFRELINGKIAVKDHFVATTIQRVEERNKSAI